MKQMSEKLELRKNVLLSASSDRLSENIGILSIVIAKLKFSNIQSKIFLADLVEGSNHASLYERPEAFNSVGMNSADDVFATRMIDGGMGELFADVLVADPLVSADQADLRRNRLANELCVSGGLNIGDRTHYGKAN